MARPAFHKPLIATDTSTKQGRELRHAMSLPEVLLWRELKGCKLGGARFRRQHPLGPFIADFYCHESSLVTEINGKAHAGERRARDIERDRWMRQRALRVSRVPASDVLADLPAVLGTIRREVDAAREPRPQS